MDLKNCPFCGDSAQFAYRKGKYGYFGYVECDLCGAMSKTIALTRSPSSYDDDDEFWGQPEFERVAKYWNRRAE